MNWKSELKSLAAIVSVFLLFLFAPVDSEEVGSSVHEALQLTKWYAQEHVILCLIPAFFIAGAIGVFVSQTSVLKYLGARANKVLAYGVASVSGSILAVCSCTVLPLFAGIYRMGAGLGPATAFLYAGPAINILAIILTARVLGFELGIARAVGAVVFSIVVGLLMHLFFIKEETARVHADTAVPQAQPDRPLWSNAVYFAALIAILVFANWGAPEGESGLWTAVHKWKWPITAAFALLLGFALVKWLSIRWLNLSYVGIATVLSAIMFSDIPLIAFSVAVVGLSIALSYDTGQGGEWLTQTWSFAKQILPLLLLGVLVSGFLLGRPGHDGLIPSQWISSSVGGNSLPANLFASVVGAFMYFATLTEIPILQGLIGNGMGKGPALALLLAGPALSLPSMLVLRSVMGTKKTVVYVALVVLMATATGHLYGLIF